MTDYPEPMERCTSCSVQLPADLIHRPHDADCIDHDLCRCDNLVCPLCCDECAKPRVIPGQVSLLPDPPPASTSGLPKRRSA